MLQTRSHELFSYGNFSKNEIFESKNNELDHSEQLYVCMYIPFFFTRNKPIQQ